MAVDAGCIPPGISRVLLVKFLAPEIVGRLRQLAERELATFLIVPTVRDVRILARQWHGAPVMGPPLQHHGRNGFPREKAIMPVQGESKGRILVIGANNEQMPDRIRRSPAIIWWGADEKPSKKGIPADVEQVLYREDNVTHGAKFDIKTTAGRAGVKCLPVRDAVRLKAMLEPLVPNTADAHGNSASKGEPVNPVPPEKSDIVPVPDVPKTNPVPPDPEPSPPRVAQPVSGPDKLLIPEGMKFLVAGINPQAAAAELRDFPEFVHCPASGVRVWLTDASRLCGVAVLKSVSETDRGALERLFAGVPGKYYVGGPLCGLAELRPWLQEVKVEVVPVTEEPILSQETQGKDEASESEAGPSNQGGDAGGDKGLPEEDMPKDNLNGICASGMSQAEFVAAVYDRLGGDSSKIGDAGEKVGMHRPSVLAAVSIYRTRNNITAWPTASRKSLGRRKRKVSGSPVTPPNDSRLLGLDVDDVPEPAPLEGEAGEPPVQAPAETATEPHEAEAPVAATAPIPATPESVISNAAWLVKLVELVQGAPSDVGKVVSDLNLLASLAQKNQQLEEENARLAAELLQQQELNRQQGEENERLAEQNRTVAAERDNLKTRLEAIAQSAGAIMQVAAGKAAAAAAS